MHNKFCLIDAASSSNRMVISGSSNWTHSVCYGSFELVFSLFEFNIKFLLFFFQGIRSNCENVTFISNKRIHNEYADAFENIWNKVASPINLSPISSYQSSTDHGPTAFYLPTPRRIIIQ